MTKDVYGEAFSEVLFLINNMQEENKKKFPNEFIEFLYDNQDKEYIPQNISLENLDSLKIETRILLSVAYRDFFLSEQDRNNKNKIDEKYLSEKYSYENLFKHENIKNDLKIINNPNAEETRMCNKNKFIEFFQVLKEKIKKFFQDLISHKGD